MADMSDKLRGLAKPSEIIGMQFHRWNIDEQNNIICLAMDLRKHSGVEYSGRCCLLRVVMERH